MLKVLILSDSYNGYGAEHMLKWLGNNLSLDEKYDITYVSIYDSTRNSDLNTNCRFYGYNHTYDGSLRSLISYIFSATKKIFKLHKEIDFDYIITFHTNPFLIALIISCFANVKLVHSERDDPYARHTFIAKFKMWLYRFADCIVFQTLGARDFFPQSVKEKSIIIPNPVNITGDIWQPKDDIRTIVNVGRLHVKFKRQDILIKAFAELQKHYDDLRLVFYGDGPDRQYLEQLVNSHHLSKSVIFKGRVSRVVEHIKNDYIFVLSSDSEGLPNALLEAMAIGMPVVSTDCSPGGARFLIEHQKNGYLVPRGNPELLYKQLLDILSNPEEMVICARYARETVSKFNPQVIINLWKEVIK